MPTTTPRIRLAMALLATTAAALAAVLTAPTAAPSTDASNRETGTVKPAPLAKPAGDKKVDVIK
ncbi:hypothetical protein ACIGHB_21445 [Streptomyces sp. NPDC085460]|uniref:hypothetical protein n=1 Tax=Streptomyces sp. NPDC085460 TaxID=3365723 RepID=UPI0037CE4D09